MKKAVTILTGFLGAGKTTLLNEIILKYPNTKFAVIENEFGEIGIDNDLVVGGDETIFEMSNGCICCTMNDELVATLAKLLNSDYNFDHLLIETTGIAEPDGVAAAFVADPHVQNYFQLNAVICMVDAKNILDMLEEREEAKRQITFSDFIILNKEAELEAEQLLEVEHKLQATNPLATIVKANYAKVTDNLLEINAYEFKTVEAKLKAQHQPSSHHHDHHHHHHSDIISHSFIFNQPFDILKLRHWMQVLLMLQGEGIYRVKAVLDVQYQDRKMILQSVRKSCAFQLGETWAEGKPRQSRIVFIGKNLRKDILEKHLKQLMALGSAF